MIQLHQLTKKFGTLEAVKQLSLEIPKGEIMGFLGPNGAGKTTTIKMICGLLAPTEGSIQFELGNNRIKNPYTHIGLVPQENIYWPKLTCNEQVCFVGSLYNNDKRLVRERSGILLEKLGLSNKTNSLAKKLSGGMKRRLNICMALIHDPEILIFDEPEAGLDPQSRILVRDFIKSLAKDKTVVISTHNMDEADRLSDRIAIIDKGSLLRMDTPGNLKRSVGEGDILEIKLDKECSSPEFLPQLQKISDHVRIVDAKIFLKSKALVGKIPDISAIITKHHLQIQEMVLRENTLEDVFIHLTGRALRS